MTSNAPVHSKISPTAKLVAHWRQFTDIPYAARVAELMDVDDAVKHLVAGFGGDQGLSELNMFAPYIEARYKSVVSVLKREGIHQVLELASGLSLRGLALTGEDKTMTYVETDLPGMHEEKARLAATLVSELNLPPRERLFFSPVNVLDRAQLDAAAAPFDPTRPLAVIHEGLFQYLGHDEKMAAAANIRHLLTRGSGGGFWLTPDIVTKAEFDDGRGWGWTEDENGVKLRERMTGIIAEVTGRDFRAAAFDDDTHVRRFFAEAGFSVTKLPQVDDSYELTSVARFGIPAEVIKTLRESAFLYLMRPID